MNIHVELSQEADGRWIGEVPEIPGVLAYGKTREEAAAAVAILAITVIKDRLKNGDLTLDDL